jgi:tetratricopeptide (TPR) repeat protein
MSTPRRAFIIMPFGLKKMPDGAEIDCDQVYNEFLVPAIAEAGLVPHRADAERRGGNIHIDMFMDLLLSEFVVADLTMDNANVWYEIGVRHALRAGGAVLVYALRDRLPFDIANQRMFRYTLKGGRLDPDHLAVERTNLVAMIKATLGAWRGRRASPVYQTLPNLQEPDWKTLKVGEVSEYWEELGRWQSRINVARSKKRPGDILVLADEVPNSVLEFEALRTAADALLSLRRPRYALSIVNRALEIDPDDLRARQLHGMALGRVGRYEEAREELKKLATQHSDGETLGILARTEKDQWTRLWDRHAKRKADPRAAGVATVDSIERAAKAYFDAFCAAPHDYYPGINALSLGRLWEDLSGKVCRLALPLSQIADGVGWTLAAANQRKESYWAYFTLAELELVRNRKDETLEAYRKAADMALADSNRFALDSARQQLALFGALGFRADLAGEAETLLEEAERLLGPDVEPPRVVVFSGHMIDNPAVRGPGKEKPARFPASKVDAAAKEIRKRLDALGAAAGDLGLCGGASGGDLLFAEACLERGMRVELRLARDTGAFLAESVTFADPGRRWEQSFDRVADNPSTTVLVMPDELGPAAEGVSVHDRCNRWILYSALSNGLQKVSCIVLWNGEPGDGPGGTQHMVQLVRTLTGRQPEIIDPATLPDAPAG